MLKDNCGKRRNKKKLIVYGMGITVPFFILTNIVINKFYDDFYGFRNNINNLPLVVTIQDIARKTCDKVKEGLVEIIQEIQENEPLVREHSEELLSKSTEYGEFLLEKNEHMKIVYKPILEYKIKIEDLGYVPFGQILGRARYFFPFLKEEGEKLGLGKYFFFALAGAESDFDNTAISSEWAITLFQITKEGVDGLNNNIEHCKTFVNPNNPIIDPKKLEQLQIEDYHDSLKKINLNDLGFNKKALEDLNNDINGDISPEYLQYVTIALSKKLKELGLEKKVEWKRLTEDPALAANVTVAIITYGFLDSTYFLAKQNGKQDYTYYRNSENDEQDLVKLFIYSSWNSGLARTKRIYTKYGEEKFLEKMYKETQKFVKEWEKYENKVFGKYGELIERINEPINPTRFVLTIEDYKIEKGDTLYDISKSKYNVPIWELKKVNKIGGDIKEGKILKIPIREYLE